MKAYKTNLHKYNYFLWHNKVGHKWSKWMVWLGLIYGVYRHFQNYVSYIIAVSFIGVGNHNTRRNHRPVASHWHILSHNVVSSTSRHKRASNSQLSRFTDCTGSCKFNYNENTTMTTPDRNEKAEKCSRGVSE